MAFPTTGVLDSFQRADEGPPPSADWKNAIFFSIDAGGMLVASNACKSANIAGGSSYWNASQFGPDCECWAPIFAFPTSGGVKFWELCARIVGPASSHANGYSARITNSPFTSKLFRIDNEVFTQIGVTSSQTLVAGDTIGIECVGSTIKMWRLSGLIWSILTTATDTTYPGSGYIGFRASDSLAAINSFNGGTSLPVAIFGSFQ